MAASISLHSPLLALTPRSRSHPHLLKPTRFYPLNPPQSQIRWKMLDRRELGFRARVVENGGGLGSEEIEEARGQSTMPERFRYLNKEVPDRPVRWPWVIVLVFLVYCWRTVLWELTNWKNAALAILRFLGYLSKLALALLFRLIGDPVTGFIRGIEFSMYFVRDIYFDIVASAPVPELTRIILFTSTIFSIAEATVPYSVSSQPYLLTMAGVIAFGAVKGVVLEPSFWLFLLGLFGYSRFIKKRDAVSAALPSAAALAAVGEPWARGLTIAFYLALAVDQHSKSSKGVASVDVSVERKRLPLPLLLAALAIGINVAAKWIRYRHLTWMIA